MSEMAFGFRGKFIIYPKHSICYFSTFDHSSDQLLDDRNHFLNSIFTQHNVVVKTAWDQILTSTVGSPVTLDKKTSCLQALSVKRGCSDKNIYITRMQSNRSWHPLWGGIHPDSCFLGLSTGASTEDHTYLSYPDGCPSQPPAHTHTKHT